MRHGAYTLDSAVARRRDRPERGRKKSEAGGARMRR
jgi:hypothetical protein